MQLKVGDKVKLLNEKGEGVVSRLLGDNQVQVEIDGFDYTYTMKELIMVDENNEVHLSGLGEDETSHQQLDVWKEADEEQGLEVPVNNRKSKPAKSPDYREVDLHIQELVDDYSGISNREIVEIQKRHFISHLEEAIQNKEQKMVVIHGVGEGVLKREIENILTAYSNVSVEDASYRLYGYGATEVVIH